MASDDATARLSERTPLFAGLSPGELEGLAKVAVPRSYDTGQVVFAEVAEDYGDLIAKEILTVHNVLEAVLTGPKCDRLFAMGGGEVGRSVDAQAGTGKPRVVAAVGSRAHQWLKGGAAVEAWRAAAKTQGSPTRSAARSTMPQAWIMRMAAGWSSGGSEERSASAAMVAKLLM